MEQKVFFVRHVFYPFVWEGKIVSGSKSFRVLVFCKSKLYVFKAICFQRYSFTLEFFIEIYTCAFKPICQGANKLKT